MACAPLTGNMSPLRVIASERAHIGARPARPSRMKPKGGPDPFVRPREV